MGVKKTISLKALFVRFLLLLVSLLIVAVLVPVFLLLFGVEIGYLSPANINETILQQTQENISRADEFSPELVPQSMSYVLLDKSLSVLDTNMSEKDSQRALLFAKGEYANSMSGKRFSLITRDNENIVLLYSFQSGYVSEKLNDILPPPELLCYISMGINALVACAAATLAFAKKVKKQIVPLHEAAKQIGNKNLDFEIGHSSIQELDDVLVSFGSMKTELKDSLEKQWKEEQKQKEQIAALAHDLKTPLTVIVGNADLLQDTLLNTEQDDYTKRLLEYAGYMEQSVSTLIELSRASSGYSLHFSETNLGQFAEELKHKILPLTSLKEMQMEYIVGNLPDILNCDATLLERAILNIVSNAVDFTPKGGTIRFALNAEDDNLVFSVSDSGKGFSPQDLSQGKERFYMGDGSRSSRHHYGMGLAIAENIAIEHGGRILLENGNGDLRGAKVSFIIPVK